MWINHDIYICGTCAIIIWLVEIRRDDQNFQKITFGYKIKNSHLVTLITIRQPPRKPECEQPSCWSSDEIEANEIIFLSADPARGHCGGVVFICAGVKPCSGHGRIFFCCQSEKGKPKKMRFWKGPVELAMKYDRDVECALHIVQVSVSALTSLTRYCNGGEHCCHVHGGNLCSEGEVGFLKKSSKDFFYPAALLSSIK